MLGLLGTVLAGPAAGAGVAAGVVEIPGVPTSVAVSPSGAWVYVANGRSVLGIDASTLQVAWTTPTGAGAADVAVSPSGAQVYAGGDRQVTVEVADPRVVAADAACARALGFGGKLCIHPQQVGPVNAAFSPSPAEIEWAQRVVAACEASAGAAVAVDGKMIDRPVLLRAQALLAQQR